jgi:hypothetical protein
VQLSARLNDPQKLVVRQHNEYGAPAHQRETVAPNILISEPNGHSQKEGDVEELPFQS